jgi:hypothetical protein
LFSNSDELHPLFCRGSTFTQVAKFSQQMGLNFISSELYHRYQRSIVTPVISSHYQASLTAARNRVTNAGKQLYAFAILVYI